MEESTANLVHVLVFSLIGGVASLVGGFLLLAREKSAQRLATYATPFAAGALLAAAFTDLLPEAGHNGSVERALTWTLVGILVFFFLERFLQWFHHHHEHEGESKNDSANVPLIVIGDTIHNAIDGIAIAAAFLVSVPTGIVATIAVAAHEIPQEIGDFGLLVKKGVRRKSVILINVASALAATITALIFFQLGSSVEIQLDIVLGLTAGFFIYIAVSDIIPEIHKSESKVIAGPQTLFLIIGVILVSLTTNFLHEYIEADEDHDHSHSGSSIIESHDEHSDHEDSDHSHEDEVHHEEHEAEHES